MKQQIVVLASDVTRNYNGRQSDLWRKMKVYGAFRTVKRKEAELDAKQAEITTLRQTVSNLKSLGFGESRQPRSDRVPDRKKGSKQMTGGQEPPLDVAFLKDRGEVCREWNTPADCTRAAAPRSTSATSRYGPGSAASRGTGQPPTPKEAAGAAGGVERIVIVTLWL